jgi:endonuclease/exonuclease/phosphatase family metal-dependent hydrolase
MPATMALRLVSWNVAGRVRRQAEQAAVLRLEDWDVVCLQEVTPTTLVAWRTALAEQGLAYVRSSLDDWIPGEPAPEGRRLGVVTGTRWPATPVALPRPPWPERLLSVTVRAPTAFELHNLHSPISQKPDRVKLRTHRALRAGIEQRLGLPQIAAGDFNTPRREHPDGTTWSFARTSGGKLRIDRGQEWEDSELAVLRGIEKEGVRDLFRELHGYDRREISWTYPRGRGGYRLDHVVASGHFIPVSCVYLHEAREAGLSDHSPLACEIELRP